MKAIPTRKVEWEGWRIIPSRNPPVDLYRRVAPAEDWPSIIKVELLTNPRVREMREGLGLIRPEDLTGGTTQNWILAPFTYLNPDGSRFSDGSYGTCLLTQNLETALLESIRLREAFLASTQEEPTRLDMRVIKTKVQGEFDDFAKLPAAPDDDAHKRFWKQRQQDGIDGVHFKLSKVATSDCVEAFRPRVLSRAVQERHLTYTWNGRVIAEIYDFREGKNVDLGRLRAEGKLHYVANPLSVGRFSAQS